MSLAVNREDMNGMVFDGLLTPRQYSPLSSSPQYHESFSMPTLRTIRNRPMHSWMRLVTRSSSEGFRLWTDGSGEEISFIIEGTADVGTPDEDAAQQVVKYLSDVGIKAALYKYFERSLYEEHYNANEIEQPLWRPHGPALGGADHLHWHPTGSSLGCGLEPLAQQQRHQPQWRRAGG